MSKTGTILIDGKPVGHVLTEGIGKAEALTNAFKSAPTARPMTQAAGRLLAFRAVTGLLQTVLSVTFGVIEAHHALQDARRLTHVRRTTVAAVNSFGVKGKRLKMRRWCRARVEYRRGEP